MCKIVYISYIMLWEKPWYVKVVKLYYQVEMFCYVSRERMNLNYFLIFEI